MWTTKHKRLKKARIANVNPTAIISKKKEGCMDRNEKENMGWFSFLFPTWYIIYIQRTKMNKERSDFKMGASQILSFFVRDVPLPCFFFFQNSSLFQPTGDSGGSLTRTCFFFFSKKNGRFFSSFV